ncbi:MAG: TIGR02757 family protein [Paludibacter sp.]
MEIKAFLDDRVNRYNRIEFIETDPILIPHSFTRKEDIEIAGFLAATIAWGQRVSIIKNAKRLMEMMDNSPYEFLMETEFSIHGVTSNHTVNNIDSFQSFVHRTFNGNDCMFFLKSLKNIYQNHGGLETVFTNGYQSDETVFGVLKHFREVFLSIPHNNHVTKHVSDVTANSSAKRLNMFLRWMVRSDENEVDFGLWKGIPTSALMLPLDVHTGDVARAFNLLNRKQNDWKAVEEITSVLRKIDPTDPIKYDFALFNYGVYELNPNY